MTDRQSAWHTLKRLSVLLVLGAALPWTPLLANFGAAVLGAFSAMTLPNSNATPTSIVVLGGGLTKKANHPSVIILNHYSQARAKTTATLHHQHPLLIITSGVESPWLRDYLSANTKKAFIISDNASMNTCENAVFTAKLLHHHELPTKVYLVTDRYHMARARRQFALAGIDTIPYDSPLSIPLSWLTPKKNLIHSRRAVYEIVALLRDIIRPQRNCRTNDRISIEEISTPRRKISSFSLLE